MRHTHTWLASALLFPLLAVGALAHESTHSDGVDADEEAAPLTQEGGNQGAASKAADDKDEKSKAGVEDARKSDQDVELQDMRDRLDRLEARADSPGSTKFLVVGYGKAGYTDVKDAHSAFGTQVNPVFLWTLGDRLMFQSELEIELEEGEAALGLEYGFASYLINDRAAIEMGKFLSPLSHFIRDLHPGWINKLPDLPMYALDGGLVPHASLGAQLTGAFPIGSGPAKMEYAAWVTNGPALILEGDDAGSLAFENNEDNNNDKAVGARIAFNATQELNIGAAVQTGKVDTSGSGAGSVNSTIATADFTYIDYFDALSSTVDLRGEYAHSDVGDPNVPYLDGGGNPLPSFDNTRDGGYVQVGLRPTHSGNELLRDLEFVARYDYLSDPTENRGRVTFGVDRWITPSSLLKLAYRMSTGSDSNDDDAIEFEWVVGF